MTQGFSSDQNVWISDMLCSDCGWQSQISYKTPFIALFQNQENCVVVRCLHRKATIELKWYLISDWFETLNNYLECIKYYVLRLYIPQMKELQFWKDMTEQNYGRIFIYVWLLSIGSWVDLEQSLSLSLLSQCCPLLYSSVSGPSERVCLEKERERAEHLMPSGVLETGSRKKDESAYRKICIRIEGWVYLQEWRTVWRTGWWCLLLEL